MRLSANLALIFVVVVVLLSFILIVFFPAFPEYLVDIFRPKNDYINETKNEEIENTLELIPRVSNNTINLSKTTLNLPTGFEISDAFVNNFSITNIVCIECAIYQIKSETGNTYYLSAPGEARFLPESDDIQNINITNEQPYVVRQYNYTLLEIDDITNETKVIDGIAKEITACNAEFGYCFSTGALPVTKEQNSLLVEEFRKLVFNIE